MSKKIDEDRIMGVFFKEPYKEFHLRQLGRIMKYNPSTLSKYLDNYYKNKLIVKEKERGYIIYKADIDSEMFKLRKVWYNLERIRKSGIIEFIENSLNYPRAIILFGSYSKGENTKESDLDLFVLSEDKKDLNLAKFEKILKNNVHLIVYNKMEFKQMKNKNKELLNNIINGVTLSGYLEVF